MNKHKKLIRFDVKYWNKHQNIAKFEIKSTTSGIQFKTFLSQCKKPHLSRSLSFQNTFVLNDPIFLLINKKNLFLIVNQIFYIFETDLNIIIRNDNDNNYQT